MPQKCFNTQWDMGIPNIHCLVNKNRYLPGAAWVDRQWLWCHQFQWTVFSPHSLRLSRDIQHDWVLLSSCFKSHVAHWLFPWCPGETSYPSTAARKPFIWGPSQYSEAHTSELTSLIQSWFELHSDLNTRSWQLCLYFSCNFLRG